HAGAEVLRAGFRGNVAKRAVTLVMVEILAAEIVGHVEIGPPVVIVVAPRGGETVTVVVFVEARAFGDVRETQIAAIAEQVIGWTVGGIVVRRGRVVAPSGRPEIIGANIYIE